MGKLISDSKEEKVTRGSLLAEVERIISPDVVVICDSLNYIKGFRYELFCRARTVKTPGCVIHCNVIKETALGWNAKRDEKDQWKTGL